MLLHRAHWVVCSIAVFASGCFGGGGGSQGSDAGETLGDFCVPYDDDCPVGTYCQYEHGRAQCVEEGTVAREEICEDRCQRGSICVRGNEFSEDSVCQQPCTLNDEASVPCDITRHTCFPAVDDAGNELDFGVCRYVQ